MDDSYDINIFNQYTSEELIKQIEDDELDIEEYNDLFAYLLNELDNIENENMINNINDVIDFISNELSNDIDFDNILLLLSKPDTYDSIDYINVLIELLDIKNLEKKDYLEILEEIKKVNIIDDFKENHLYTKTKIADKIINIEDEEEFKEYINFFINDEAYNNTIDELYKIIDDADFSQDEEKSLIQALLKFDNDIGDEDIKDKITDIINYIQTKNIDDEGVRELLGDQFINDVSSDDDFDDEELSDDELILFDNEDEDDNILDTIFENEEDILTTPINKISNIIQNKDLTNDNKLQLIDELESFLSNYKGRKMTEKQAILSKITGTTQLTKKIKNRDDENKDRDVEDEEKVEEEDEEDEEETEIPKIESNPINEDEVKILKIIENIKKTLPINDDRINESFDRIRENLKNDVLNKKVEIINNEIIYEKEGIVYDFDIYDFLRSLELTVFIKDKSYQIKINNLLNNVGENLFEKYKEDIKIVKNSMDDDEEVENNKFKIGGKKRKKQYKNNYNDKIYTISWL